MNDLPSARSSRKMEPCPASEMLAAPSVAGGLSIGCEAGTDLSEGQAACYRSDHGTQPGNTPAKTPPKTARDFERAMRELGYSRREANLIAARGFKGLAEASPSEDVSELAALIQRNTALLKG